MNVSVIIEFIAALLILVGGLMAAVSAFGIIRLPDSYNRSHAATKSSTLAVLLALLGAFIFFWGQDGTISIRLILGIVFVFLTAPVSGHLITRAAYRGKYPLADITYVDELKEEMFPESDQENKREKEENSEPKNDS